MIFYCIINKELQRSQLFISFFTINTILFKKKQCWNKDLMWKRKKIFRSWEQTKVWFLSFVVTIYFSWHQLAISANCKPSRNINVTEFFTKIFVIEFQWINFQNICRYQSQAKSELLPAAQTTRCLEDLSWYKQLRVNSLLSQPPPWLELTRFPGPRVHLQHQQSAASQIVYPRGQPVWIPHPMGSRLLSLTMSVTMLITLLRLLNHWRWTTVLKTICMYSMRKKMMQQVLCWFLPPPISSSRIQVESWRCPHNMSSWNQSQIRATRWCWSPMASPCCPNHQAWSRMESTLWHAMWRPW